MKKTIALLMSLAVLAAVTACTNTPPESRSESTTSQTVNEEPVKLTNKMSANELSRADKHALTLLDEPSSEREHKVELQQKKVPLDEYKEQYLEPYRDLISDEDYQLALDELEKSAEKGKTEIVVSAMVFIDGCYYMGYVPEEDYDGGEFTYQFSHLSDDYDGVSAPTEDDIIWEWKTAANPEEYLEQYRKALESDHEPGDIESMVEQARIVFDAIINKTYVEVPDGTYDLYSVTDGMNPLFRDPLADYRSSWEFSRSDVEAIKDSIDEYTLYDDELETEFLVHVVLPPDYDSAKSYPVLFLTDGVWRFGNTPSLRRAMENGEAADVLLVTLGYSYGMDGTEEANRFTHLVIERDKLLDFITDNVMPYLGEQYNIDYADSTLFGHSDGGVFAHNALFKSDKYENQPFGRYIIGSPAFWGLYDDELDLDTAGCETDYGYFDRNEGLNKSVFLCGGDKEDPDYEDMYRGHATTLEGLASLNERLEAHGADVTYKLYDSHHYQFIPQMLIEYLKQTYPPEN